MMIHIVKWNHQTLCGQTVQEMPIGEPTCGRCLRVQAQDKIDLGPEPWWGSEGVKRQEETR